MDTADRSVSEAPPLSPRLNAQLSLMMFLQYAIWGAWLPLLWPFLKNVREFDGGQIGDMFAVGAVGALVAPFIAGQVADRFFNTEKFLGISHLLGAVLVWQLASVETYGGFLAFSLVYSLIYSPTLSLTNSLAFHHVPDRDRDFGKVRLWGTIGWIVAGILIGQWLANYYGQERVYEGMGDAFRLSAMLGGALGLFCLFGLPKTPPTPGEKKNATFEALGEVKRQPLITLFLLAVPVSCIHQFYFVHTAGFLNELQTNVSGEGLANAINKVFGYGGGGLMTIGQMVEIAVLAAIPFVAKSMSRKSLLALGLAAYALRMALFAYAPAWGSLALPAVIAGVGLHGFCFGCFIFVAFMVVDEETTEDVRASAQSLFNLVIVGIGIIVGSKIAGSVSEWAAAGAVEGEPWYGTFTRLFSIPMWASLVCLVLLLVFYRSRRDGTPEGQTA